MRVVSLLAICFAFMLVESADAGWRCRGGRCQTCSQPVDGDPAADGVEEVAQPAPTKGHLAVFEERITKRIERRQNRRQERRQERRDKT